MGKRENIAPCQGYVGWADVESVEYKYPPRNAVKYVLRITLVGSSPRVWREIAVPSNIKLTYHVYMDGADMYDYPIEDASDYALCDLLAAGEKMTFIYDFGDTWRHTVKVLECVDYGKEEKQHIRLLDGKNACPPNDVGGIGGYKEMLKVIKEDPDSEEAWEYYTWLGSKWNEKFFPAIDTAIALNELNYKR